MLAEIQIRNIEPSDNVAIASVIRNALAEFGANKPGTVFFDPTTDHLFELFKAPGSVYYVAEKNGIILGGCGIFPTEALPEKTCDLRHRGRPQARPNQRYRLRRKIHHQAGRPRQDRRSPSDPRLTTPSQDKRLNNKGGGWPKRRRLNLLLRSLGV